MYRAAWPAATTAELRQALLDDVDPVPAFAGKSVTGGRLSIASLAEGALGAVRYTFTSLSAPAGVVTPGITAAGEDAAGDYAVTVGLGMAHEGEIWAVADKAVTLGDATGTTDDAGEVQFDLGTAGSLAELGLSPTLALGDGRYVLTVQLHRDGAPLGRTFAAPLLVGTPPPVDAGRGGRLGRRVRRLRRLRFRRLRFRRLRLGRLRLRRLGWGDLTTRASRSVDPVGSGGSGGAGPDDPGPATRTARSGDSGSGSDGSGGVDGSDGGGSDGSGGGRRTPAGATPARAAPATAAGPTAAPGPRFRRTARGRRRRRLRRPADSGDGSDDGPAGAPRTAVRTPTTAARSPIPGSVRSRSLAEPGTGERRRRHAGDDHRQRAAAEPDRADR